MKPRSYRILHVITRFLRGGADENTLITMAGLAKAGHDVTLVHGTGFDSRMVSRAQAAGIRVIRMPLQHYNPFSAVPALAFLVNHIRENRYDIVHTHSTEAGIIGRLAARIARTPVIVHTVHGTPHLQHRNLLIRALITIGERLVAPMTTAYIANSPSIVRQFTAAGIGTRDQYTVIPSGIDIARFRAGPRPPKHPLIITASRLVRGKGIETLLDAAPAVVARHPTARFLIAGDGPLEPEFERHIALHGLRGIVTLAGFRNDLPALFCRATLFALPTNYEGEGTPRAITEAMAAGLPVISTPISGIPDQIVNGRTGFLIPPNNPQALAEKICELIEHPATARRMGAAGRKRVHTWSTARMVHNIEQLYHSLSRNT